MCKMNHKFWPQMHRICVFHHGTAKSHEGLEGGIKVLGAVEALLSLLEQISLIGGKYALEVKYILGYIEGMNNIHLDSTT